MKMRGIIALSISLALMTAGSVSATMTSTNYRIYGDSIGSVGGRGTSTNYILEGTGEESPSGESSSTNYVLLAGFESLSEHPVFTFSVSASTLPLGNLSVGVVSDGSYTATTSTNAPFGYTTYIYEDGNLRAGALTVDDVADGAVTAGSEEYGVAVSGTDAAFGTDQPIATSPLAVATRTTWVNGSQITLTHKAAISAGTISGVYAHTVTLMSVPNF